MDWELLFNREWLMEGVSSLGIHFPNNGKAFIILCFVGSQ